MKKLLLLLALCFTVPVFGGANTPVGYNNAAVTATAVLVTTTPYVSLQNYAVSNVNSSAVYVQFFDAASAGAVTLGTTPPTIVKAISSNGTLDGSVLPPFVFVNGIVIAVTTTPTGNTPPTTAVPVFLTFQ